MLSFKIFDLQQFYKELIDINAKRMLAQKLKNMSFEEREREVINCGIGMNDVNEVKIYN